MGILERHADKWEPTAYGCWIWTAAVSAAPARRPMVGIAGNKVQVVARLVCEENFGPRQRPSIRRLIIRQMDALAACALPLIICAGRRFEKIRRTFQRKRVRRERARHGKVGYQKSETIIAID